MFDFHEKRKIRRVVYSKPFIGAIFVMTALLCVSVYERYAREREMAQKLEDRTEELHALESRASLLESKVEHLKNERGIEEELRTRFDVAKEGEQVVVIIDETSPEKGNSTVTSPVNRGGEGGTSFFEMLKFW